MVNRGAVAKRRTSTSLDSNPLWAQVLIYIVLSAAGLITILPIVNVVAVSLSEASAIFKNPMMILPQSFTIEAYKYIFATPVLLKSFGITVYVTVVGTFLNLVVTILGAYGLSKTQIPGNRILMWMVIIPMLFSAGLIPIYILYTNLGLINNIWVLIIPGLASPFNLILMRNFFWSIPEELEESTKIDGASDWQVLWHVVIPLSKAVIATVGMFYGVAHWNDFFTGLFFINDNTKWPLQVVLRSIIIVENMQNMGGAATSDPSKIIINPANIKAATIIFSVVPIVMVYPFLQKYFVKGIMLGSVKG